MIRSYKKDDYKVLAAILAAEGLPPDDFGFEEYKAWVFVSEGIIKGFFALKEEWGYPSLVHFCVGKEYRSPKTTRELLKRLKSLIKETGFNKLIVHSKKDYLDRLIQYYFKKKPYAFKEGCTFYLVSVSGGKK